MSEPSLTKGPTVLDVDQNLFSQNLFCPLIYIVNVTVRERSLNLDSFPSFFIRYDVDSSSASLSDHVRIRFVYTIGIM